MNKILGAAILASALCTGMGVAAAADETVSENRAIDAHVLRIKLGGTVDLQLKQGATPSLVLIGDKRAVSKVRAVQSGDTLQIETQGQVFHFFGGDRHKVRAELTLPSLQELASHGVGSSDVSGFSGDTITLRLDGAGSVIVSGHYKNVDARLGGVGSMKIDAGGSDRIDLAMHGAGHMTVSGQSKVLHAKLGGVGSLDAQALHADSVELDMSGAGGATVYAKDSADLTLSGLGSATVYGLGDVSWR
jgi:hypothetical protein